MSPPADSRIAKVRRNLLPVLLWGVMILTALLLMQRVLSGNTIEQQKAADRDVKQKQAVAQSTQSTPAAIASMIERQGATERDRQEQERKQQTQPGNPAANGVAASAPGHSPQLTARPATGAPVDLRLPQGAPPSPQGLPSADGAEFGAGTPADRSRAQARASDLVAFEIDPDPKPQAAASTPMSALMDQLKGARVTATPPAAGPQAIADYVKSLQPGAAPSPRAPGASGVGTLSGRSEDWLGQQAQLTQSDQPLTPKAASSEYLVFEGTPIRIALLADINSDLPGAFSAMVTRDVYDSVMSRYPLIPQGTIMRGSYNSEVMSGQNRLLFAFNRMIFQSGASIRLGGMPGSDLGGATGAEADVNNHFWTIFGSSLAVGTAALLASAATSAPTNVTIDLGGAGNPGSALATQALSDVVKQMLSRNQNIKPTLSLRKGEQLTVVTTRDMSLPPSVTGVQVSSIERY